MKKTLWIATQDRKVEWSLVLLEFSYSEFTLNVTKIQFKIEQMFELPNTIVFM